MKKTAEKVIFSTIYTILIALVVTYICHRELEPADMGDSMQTRSVSCDTARFEELSAKLRRLDVQNGDTRDLVTNLITILKDCSSK